jgi:poly(3-hydroxybutyrate) depolymerase
VSSLLSQAPTALSVASTTLPHASSYEITGGAKVIDDASLESCMPQRMSLCLGVLALVGIGCNSSQVPNEGGVKSPVSTAVGGSLSGAPAQPQTAGRPEAGAGGKFGTLGASAAAGQASKDGTGTAAMGGVGAPAKAPAAVGGSGGTSAARGAAGAAAGSSSAAAGAVSPPASSTTTSEQGSCGPGSKKGRSDEMLMVAGIARTFVYYAPADLDPSVPVPVVIAAHGFVMSGDMMFNITGYQALADREKFVVIFPDGDPESVGPWNVGDGICGLGSFVAGLGDDQVFIDEMLRFVEADRCIDHDHIFMTGFSMGGYFSNHTGCLRSDIRAIAPHSGGSHDLSACMTKHKPAIIHHFVADSLIDYACGAEARDRWVARNGCSPMAPDVQMVEGGKCEYYRECPADGQVAFCSYELPAGGGGELVEGHAWSGGAQDVPSGGSFAIPGTASATDLTWAFWKKYAW